MGDWRALVDGRIEDMSGELCAMRRHLHAHPEPSREEYRTAEYLAGKLEAEGIPVRTVPSRRGLVAGPEANDHSPRVAFRADIDALRIHDLKDVSYRSTYDGFMHACGHDAHATMAMGAAMALWRSREALPWPVPWRAIFQPAEEVGEGAREMIAAGAVDGVAAVVALHVDPGLAVGRVGQCSGVMTAFCSDLEVSVRGLGGHAARPHQSTDPIAAAVQFVAAAYQLVPRSVDAREAAVVTFGAIHGGASANVIPERVELLGTVRTLSQPASAKVEERLRQIAQGLAGATGCEIDVRFDRGVDAVVNDPAVTAVCTRAAAEVVGTDHVIPIELPSMGGEDFAGYLSHAPGCLLRLGVASDDRPRHLLHSPYFDIDERALGIGARILARSVVLLCEQRGRP
jgi:amidohydrolase